MLYFSYQLVQNSDFAACAGYLPKQKKGAEELVLRFFAVKNARDLFRGSVRDWLGKSYSRKSVFRL